MARPGDVIPPQVEPLPRAGRGEADERPSFDDILARTPEQPGCYLMKDRRGRIFYVGKAVDLRARLRQYFTQTDTRDFVPLLGRILADVETIVTRNEKEALLLENQLIKQHQPRFNVKLRDDKNFLVLRLDAREKYPRLEVTRRIGQDGARYFGPYHSATSCRETLRVVNRHFQLRTCSDKDMASRKRPCLQYQIKRCPGPCVYPVPESEYGQQVDDVTLFLQGRDKVLLDRLRERMHTAAAGEEFERAAQVRDQLQAVERTLTDQKVVSSTPVDQDVFGLYREGDRLEIAVLHVRQGKLLGRRTFSFHDQTFPDEESLSSFVGLYYDLGSYVPDEVLLPIELADAETHAEALRERPERQSQSDGRKVDVLHPVRGARKALVELAQKNAETAFHESRTKEDDALAALEKLQKRLRLHRLPRRIECYDISHFAGTLTVASMVVLTDAQTDKSAYRKFKVRSAGNDDFQSMYEVMTRRFTRAKQGDKGWDAPDLVVIDGGKGQLGAAMAALQDLGISTTGENAQDIIALAKERTSFARRLPKSRAERAAAKREAAAAKRAAKNQTTEATLPEEPAMAAEIELQAMEAEAPASPPPPSPKGEGLAPADRPGGEGAPKRETVEMPDRVFLPRIKDPIRLASNTAELFLLARIRDEAHRFAITFQRDLRRKQATRSALRDIPGIGGTRAKALLRHLGSLRAVKQASVDDLAAAPGMSKAAAEAVHRFFHTAATSDTASDTSSDLE
jgi:excinuclease ABC subunit C